jgi:hypothetical protein
MTLGRHAIKIIHSAVDRLFDRAKQRLLGLRPPKEIRIQVVTTIPHESTIPGMFDSASIAEGVRPDEELRQSLIGTAEQYLDAHRELAKARTAASVQAWLYDAHKKGIKTDLETVLGGELSELTGKITTGVKQIVETETNKAKNAGSINAVNKIATTMGIADPVVYFVVVKDKSLCQECKRLHLHTDGVTPRLWKLSEIGAGYHKKGDSNPKTSGLHPHCRCSMVSLMPGFGFKNGRATYIGPDHNEFDLQRR